MGSLRHWFVLAGATIWIGTQGNFLPAATKDFKGKPLAPVHASGIGEGGLSSESVLPGERRYLLPETQRRGGNLKRIWIPLTASPTGVTFQTPKGTYRVEAQGMLAPSWRRLYAYAGRRALWIEVENSRSSTELEVLEALLNGALLQKAQLDREAQAHPDGWEMSQRCQAVRWMVKTLWDLYDQKKAKR